MSNCQLCGTTREQCKNKYCSENPKYRGKKKKKEKLKGYYIKEFEGQEWD